MSRTLKALERIRAEYGPGLARRKLELVAALDRERLRSAKHVHALHETLCFLRAYPDDAELLAAVERRLASFDARRDLREFAEELADSGIAGTPIDYRFFAEMARWLAQRWPDRLRVLWDELEDEERLQRLLHQLVLPAEAAGMEEIGYTLRRWCERLAGPGESEGAFLVRRLAALDLSPALYEYLYQELGLWLRLEPGPDTPTRTRAHHALGPVHFQDGPLRRARPELVRELRRPPLAIRAVSRREGERLIDLAREALVTRSRDLDAFSYGDPDDVRVVECGEGLCFVAVGVRPERRLLFEAVYAFLTLKNGVPIGYVLNSALYGSAEIAYNVFETYRGAEAGAVYGRVLSTVRALFGSDSFTIYPYQLGDDNDEALESGAWWFYQKLGFRPKDPATLRVMERELAALRRDPAHRTPIETLRVLARENVYWHLGAERDDVIGSLAAGDAGLAVSARIAARHGSDREGAEREALADAARLLRTRPGAGWSRGEREAWRRWAPIVRELPGIERWSAAQRRALVSVVRAKGGRRESDFVRLFDAHRPLRRALTELAAQAEF